MERQHPAANSIPGNWRDLNRANWNERVPIHIAAPNAYNLDALRAGTGKLDPIATGVMGPAAGKRVLHLQCHFGMDTLVLGQQGALVTGLDFSSRAIAAARSLAAELALTDRARFIEADIYDALAVLPERGAFDCVFVSWGALCWLPDIVSWARIIATYLAPGGFLALAEAHPFIYVFDSDKAAPGGMPVWWTPYLGREALLLDVSRDYADPTVQLRNSRTCEWLHPISDVVTALIDAGLRIDWFREHDSLTWRFFDVLEKRGPHEYIWPEKPWLPLSYSLRASKA